MTIHKGNIEAYLLDYLEGNLDAILTAELMAFLSENPEYEKWIPEYDGHICLETGPVFEEKQVLKKEYRDIAQINEHNFEEFCIASSEGLLDGNDRARLDEYLGMHPENQRDFDFYGKVFLQPDYFLVYPDKKNLKKRGPLVIPFRVVYYALAVAATIALLILLVSRKPSEQTVSGRIQEKPGIDAPAQNKAVEETVIPEAPSVAVTSAHTARPVQKIADTTVKAVVPGENNRGIQPLASLEPIGIKGISAHITSPAIQKAAGHKEITVTLSPSKETVTASEQTPVSILGSLVKKVNFWKAAEKAVTGFNYLTESRLSLVRTMDENGKFSSLSLESEDYVMSDNKVK